MITRNDCLLLLKELQNRNVDTTEILKKIITKPEVDLECLKFINDHRPLDLTNFYKKLRKSYNEKKSKLYGNIVKEDVQPETLITTLSALLLQIILFSNKVANKQLFLKHARAQEISTVLDIYFKDYDLTNSINLLRIIKADLKAIEAIYR